MRVFTSVLLGVCLLGASAAQAAIYVAADKSPATRLCVSAAMDSAVGFVIKMRESNMTRPFIANRITCNGKNITTFAYEAGNTKNYQRLSRYHRGFVEISDLAKVPAVKTTDAVVAIQGGSTVVFASN